MRGGDKKKATIIKAFIYKKYENQWGNLFVSKINFCTAIDKIVFVCTNSGFSRSIFLFLYIDLLSKLLLIWNEISKIFGLSF